LITHHALLCVFIARQTSVIFFEFYCSVQVDRLQILSENFLNQKNLVVDSKSYERSVGKQIHWGRMSCFYCI
jgi:hypothetical protein